MGTFMPSEIARLVLGYLEEQNCMSAYDEFLNVSPYLDECRGRNFTTVLMGYSLTDILEDYSSTQAHLLSCKPEELRRELRRYRTLLDKVKILAENVHLKKLLNNYTITSSSSTKNSTQTSVESPIKKHVQKTNNSKMCSDCNLLAANCVCKQHLPILPNLFATPFKIDLTQAVELSSLPIESLVETTRLCDLPGTDNVEQKAMDKTAIPVENSQLQVETDLHLTDLTEKDMDISDCSTKNKRHSDQTKSSQDLSFNLSVKTNELLNCSEKRFWEVNDNSATENKIDMVKAPVYRSANGSGSIEDTNKKHRNPKEDCVKIRDRPNSSFDEFANGVTGGISPRKSSTTGDTTSTPELDVNIHQKKSKFIDIQDTNLATTDELHTTNAISADSNLQVDGNVNQMTNHCQVYRDTFMASENPVHYVKPSLKVDVNSKIYSVNVSQTSNTNSLYVLHTEPESSSQLQVSESSSQFLPYVSTRHDVRPSSAWQQCTDEFRSNLLTSQDGSKGNDRNVIILSNDIVDTNVLKNERKLVTNKRLENKLDTNKAGVDGTIASQMIRSNAMYTTAPMCTTQSATNTEHKNVNYAQNLPIGGSASVKNIATVERDAPITQEIEVAPRNIVSGKVPDVFISNGIIQIAPMTRSSSQNKIFSEADIMSMPTVIMLNATEDSALSGAINQINVPVLSLPETSAITILDDEVITEKTVANSVDQKTERKTWQPMALMYNDNNISNNIENDKVGISLQASSKSNDDLENATTPRNMVQNKKSSSTPRRQHPHVRVLDFKSPPRHTSERENIIMPVNETNCNSKVEVEKFKFDQKDNKVRTKLSTLYEECSVKKKVALDGCEIHTNTSKNQFIPSVDDGKMQADLKAWSEVVRKKNSWDQDLRALIVKQIDEDSGRKLKTKRVKNPKSKKKVKEKLVQKRICKSTADNSLDNSLEKNGKLLEEILELDNEKKLHRKSNDTVIEDKKQTRRRLANKKHSIIKHKTSEKQPECNKTSTVKEVILDHSIAAMKVDIIKPIVNVKAEQRSFKGNMKNELDNKPPVSSTQITPEISKENVPNLINAKCNLASLLETPLKMSMLDIPMQTPRFVSPGKIFDPTSDIKILTIQTPNFLNSPKNIVNKMASSSKMMSPYSRPTDYSSGSSYYKPDENECTIDFTDVQSDAQDPLILTEKDYEEQLKPGLEGNAEKLFSCKNVIQEVKTIRPRRQCTLKVQCYNENIKFPPFSKPVLEVNKITKRNIERGLKKVTIKKEKINTTTSPEYSIISSSNDSLLLEDVEREKFKDVSSEPFDTGSSPKQVNSHISAVDIEQGTGLFPSKIDKALNNGTKKQTKLSIKNRETHISSKSKINKIKTKYSKPVINRGHIKSVQSPKLSCRHISKNTCSSCHHPETKPLPTKSRRKSSTPRKLEAISFKEERNQLEICELPVVNKFIQNEQVNAEEELPSLHFSSDEADTNIENIDEEAEKRDDPFISEIREYIKSSDNTNSLMLIDYPKKNKYDPETAKLIERDLLGSPNTKKEFSIPSLKSDQQTDSLEKPVVYATPFSNNQSIPSYNVKLSVEPSKDNANTQHANDNPLGTIENSTTAVMCNSPKAKITENKSLLSVGETGISESPPSDTGPNENAETVVEWSISESNRDSRNFISMCDWSIHDRSTLYRPHVGMDSFLMDIGVYNTETEEEEDRKLNISSLIQLFIVNPKRDYSRSKKNIKNQRSDKLNQIETLGHTKFFKETSDKSPEPRKESYDQSETALAVQSIMGMEKLYTPDKNRLTLSKRCLELFGETASNISSPDKDDAQKDVEIAVSGIGNHKELDRSELEDGEYVSENDSETCLGDCDALKTLDHRKRKIEVEPDESQHEAKKSKDMHAPHMLLKELDIECILSKLHGPK